MVLASFHGCVSQVVYKNIFIRRLVLCCMVIQWIIIALFVFIGLFALKMEHSTKRYKVIVIVVIGFLLYFSMMSLFSSQEVDLSNPRGIVNAVYIYFGWVGQTAGNLWDVGTETVSMVGNAVKTNNSDEEVRR